MRPHKWEIELVSAPGICTDEEFWRCWECGAGGGPKWPRQILPRMAIAIGHGVSVSLIDCDSAKQEIEFLEEKYGEGK